MGALSCECCGSGWVPYPAETQDGHEEWAWRLCNCGEGHRFPPLESVAETIDAQHSGLERMES